MTRWILWLALLLGLPSLALSQQMTLPIGNIGPKTIQNDAHATGPGTAFNIQGYTVVSFEVSALTGTATIIPEQTQTQAMWSGMTCYLPDGVSATTSFTAVGTYRCNLTGENMVRARISVCTGCHVTITATAYTQGTYALSTGGGGGSGSVTSVGLAAPAEFTISNSPITTNGNLTISWSGTLTAHGVVIGNGATGLAITGVGNAGQCLVSNGAGNDPTFQSCGSGGANQALSNLLAVNINTSLLTQNSVDLGSAGQAFRNLYLYGAGTYGSTSFQFTGAPTGNRVITVQDATTTLVGTGTTDTLTNKTLTNPSIAASALTATYTNDTVTGTTNNKLAKLTGNPSKAIITAITDTGGSVGIVVSGGATSGSSQIAVVGLVSCVFDGATTAGDYVQISPTLAGQCHDTGSTYPNAGQVIGRVLSTNGGAGTYLINQYDEVRGFAASGVGFTGSPAANQVAVFSGSSTISGTSALTWDGTNFSAGTCSTQCVGIGQLGTLKLDGSASGTLTMVTQTAAGTPTITWGTSTGTPAVTASSPLVLTTATGNLTCPTCVVSAPSFTAITSGTNTTAAMIVGSGASLTYTGSGTINATTVAGSTVANVWTKTVAPTTAENTAGGYITDDMWINTTASPNTIYVKTKESAGSATWIRVDSAANAGRLYKCVLIVGDPGAASSVLVNDNDSPVGCSNDLGTDVTITTVACWADAGSPTVTPILTGGSGTSVLSGALTCGTAAWAAGTVNGTPVVHTFSGTGATCTSTPCTVDANITTAGGVAKYVVMKITGTY